MISLISIGISEYNNEDSIPCAVKDSELIYKTFETSFECEFESFNSCCFSNLSSDEFHTLLNVERTTMSNTKNILIIYFSGHAHIENDKLKLLFSDYDGKHRGFLDVYEIANVFSEIQGQVLLILDCCQSGKAASIASANLGEIQFGILASCEEYQYSKYKESGSEFTNYLCIALKHIAHKNEEVSLVSLSKQIEKLGYEKTVVNTGASKNGDFILFRSNVFDEFNDFPKRFLNRLFKSDSIMRESLWYYLTDIPQNVNENIFKEYFKSLNHSSNFAPESSWLVRRAIGSVICQFDELEYISKLLCQSLYWQEQCIGLIALRYKFNHDDNIYNYVLELVKKECIVKIDAVWLANLYMSENINYDYRIFLNTNLALSSWGIHEIYKTISHKNISDDDFINSLHEKGVNVNVISEFNKIIINNHDSKFERYIFEQKNRGRLPKKIKSKFLLSALYGNWRGSIDIRLKNYLDTAEHRQIESDLKKAKSTLDVNIKMALFEWFEQNISFLYKYQTSLLWGLYEPHLWVRREAIKAFKAIGHDIEEIYKCIKKLMR